MVSTLKIRLISQQGFLFDFALLLTFILQWDEDGEDGRGRRRAERL